MRVPFVLSAVLAAAVVAVAAPPVVTVEPEIKGEIGAFVAVRASVTEASVVKFVPLDKGLNLFPADLLADKTATVATTAKAGRYRILCYSGNADGPSEPVITTVVIGSPDPTPDKPTDPEDPVPTPSTRYYFTVVRADGPAAPEFERWMKLSAWDDVRKAGHYVKDFEVSKLPPGIAKPTALPSVVVMVQNTDGKTFSEQKRGPMPTTNEQIKELLK